MANKIKWACPRCGAPANEHGKGGHDTCHSHKRGADPNNACMGFICDCDWETGPEHGESYQDPCEEAYCYHCGWGGTFPEKPKGLQSWEKKALDAGWTMPEARMAELGLATEKKK